ncbi:hypothetical protein CR513_06257, partial [Mucuna pruriens]
MEHPTDMCPTLQETKIESTEIIKALGDKYQYGRQSYPNWHQDHAGSESRQLSIAGSKIPGTSIPPTTATANAATIKFSHNGGFDFTISTKYNCHYT